MFNRENLQRLIFLDIETVSLTRNYDSLPERLKPHWDKKSTYLQRNSPEPVLPPAEFYVERAAIYAEFAKVVCISSGYLKFEGDTPVLKVKSCYGPDEALVLQEFGHMLDRFPTVPKWLLCAHNGKEFDFPFLGRRFLVNGIELPRLLQIQGRKPWEIPHIDTMELWKFGDYKSFVSLDLLTALLDIPSPKEQMDGSMVGSTFWEEGDCERIRKYCEQDVLATAQLVLKFARQKLIPEDGLISV
ncbi:MAG: 3'-5' exonuclease [Acidobacteria bacterium]|nr:MAG: 3'-5' exonuclease [Acidobacteriota bacterium]